MVYGASVTSVSNGGNGICLRLENLQFNNKNYGRGAMEMWKQNVLGRTSARGCGADVDQDDAMQI